MKVYDRLMDSLLTPDLAELLVKLRADTEIQSRVDELADKCNEGQLTPDEREEYSAYVDASEMIAILQAKARLCLQRQRA